LGKIETKYGQNQNLAFPKTFRSPTAMCANLINCNNLYTGYKFKCMR